MWPLILRRELRCFARIRRRSHDCEAELSHWQRPDRDMRTASRRPIGIEQLIPAQHLDHVRRACHPMIGCIGIVLSPERIGIGSEGESPVASVGEHASSVLEIAFAQHEMPEYQEAAGCAVDREPPLHRGIVARRDSAHRDHAIGERVNPPAVAQSHLERRRDGQQTPAVPRIDQRA